MNPRGWPLVASNLADYVGPFLLGSVRSLLVCGKREQCDFQPQQGSSVWDAHGAFDISGRPNVRVQTLLLGFSESRSRVAQTTIHKAWV